MDSSACTACCGSAGRGETARTDHDSRSGPDGPGKNSGPIDDDTIDGDRAYIINAGEVLAHGEPQLLLDNPDVREIYLGHDFKM